ncbi:twin-arginine translocation signal domain-containing protein [Pseudogemmobacter bohemicus]|uniref:twin-arginine translocation signal domain-containing protein n=1 Tax=Pseudogemmobacter bohemicus TaxID=2250708 RepID=UPI000DD3DB89|nr:twin-arginine translocation signal domain-containing protein [Pseudogemmobacter bohemicus]
MIRKWSGAMWSALILRGVLRRNFLAKASAGAAALAFAVTAGLPNVALASGNGKPAFIPAFMSNEDNQILNGTFGSTTKALDFLIPGSTASSTASASSTSSGNR